jgi:hypothetical protein
MHVGGPNFFLVGASKAGTTSLYQYLGQHPQIYMSPMKEPHFLADEIRLENFAPEMRAKIERWRPAFQTYLEGPMSEQFPSGPVSEWQDYLKLFRNAGDRLAIGEASPCYLWSKTAPRNIAARFPHARIVMVLRDPAERAFAQHLHTLSFARAPISFREHMDAALRATHRQIGELYPFLEFGLYGEQLERYLELFPRDRIRVLFYEDYQRDPVGLLRDIFGFLGVDQAFTPDVSERHMESRVPRSFALDRFARRPASRLLPAGVRRGLGHVLRGIIFRPRSSMALSADDRARLVDYYRTGILQLEKLVDRDLSRWLVV